jgi:DNA polymerase-3 subunit gamma/tau
MGEVFYRKWRPQRLDQVVGQEWVSQTLLNAVTLGRVAHAYLFCGPRGTGKTSTARILAKAVNCLAPQDGEPDNECEICVSINEARALDLIEIDAASNRGIDDIRDLRNKVHFAPSQARQKVYIIDEVHMLTEYAFNALLKTLEEPPQHAIFVLATTEAHKVPLTIVSRCQRFDFRRISPETAVARLSELCASEGIEVEASALALIARAAAGSLRDAQNLLEQALLSYGSPVTEEHLRDLLELGSDERALELVGHIISGSVRDGLAVINEVAGQGADLRQFHRGVMEYLRGVLLVKSEAGTPLGYPDETQARMKALAQQASLDHLVRALKMYAGADMPRDASTPLPLELALVESSLEAKVAAAPAAPAPTPTSAGHAEAPAAAPVRPSVEAPTQRSQNPPPQVADSVEAPPQEFKDLPSEPLPRLETQWGAILKSLSRHKGKRFNLGALLRDCREREVADGLITLKFSHRSHMERMQEELGDPQSRKVLREALQDALDGSYEIEVSAMEGQANGPRQSPSQRSHLVRAAQAMGAQVVAEKEEESE